MFGILRTASTEGKELNAIGVDLCDVALVARGIVVAAGADLAFDVHERSLVDVALDEECAVATGDDVVPFGAFRNLCTVGQTVSAFVGSEREVGYGVTAIKVADVGFAPYVSDQDDFVQ